MSDRSYHNDLCNEARSDVHMTDLMNYGDCGACAVSVQRPNTKNAFTQRQLCSQDLDARIPIKYVSCVSLV